MFSGQQSLSKILASANPSPDAVLHRADLEAHILDHCMSGANLRFLLQFIEKNLPRILVAVQKPAGPPSVAISGSSTIPVTNAVVAVPGILLSARNATALLIKYCQQCRGGSGGSLPPSTPAPVIGGQSGGAAHPPPATPSPLNKIVPVMIAILGRKGNMPESVALDVQRILLAAVEKDHGATLHSINITLRPDIAAGAVRNLTHSMVIGETLISLFGSALNAKAMMVEVTDPGSFVAKWVEHNFPSFLVEQLGTAMGDIECAPYFFFFQEMLKRAFSPNVGPMVDHILKIDTFRVLFDTALAAAEDAVAFINTRQARRNQQRLAALSPRSGDGTNTATAENGSAAPANNEDDGGDDNEDADPSHKYPYLSEALNLVFQCIGIIRRSLPPSESKAMYLSRRLNLAHGPLKVVLDALPRLVAILHSALPADFEASVTITRRHRIIVEKMRAAKRAQHAASSFDACDAHSDDNDDDAVQVGDDVVVGEDERPQRKEDCRCRETRYDAPFTSYRLAVTDILVELVLFRSRVCDEALVASGAVDALLDCSEVFVNNDLLLRNVHRVIMGVMQRPAFSSISLASNVAAAKAAEESSHTRQGQGGQGNSHHQSPNHLNNNNGGGGSNNNSKQRLLSSGNLSFAASMGSSRSDLHPSFTSVDDLKRSLGGDDHQTTLPIACVDDDTWGRLTSPTQSLGRLSPPSPKVRDPNSNKAAGPVHGNDSDQDVDSPRRHSLTAGAVQRLASNNNNNSGNSACAKRPLQPLAFYRPLQGLRAADVSVAMEEEREYERGILSRLDPATLTMVRTDPLLRFLLQKRPINDVLAAWAATPDPMADAERRLMPAGAKHFKDFSRTSLQAHATHLLTRLREMAASETLRDECLETLHCTSEIATKLNLWQQPITGARFFMPGSGCRDAIVHRPTVVHRNENASLERSGADSWGANIADWDASNMFGGQGPAPNGGGSNNGATSDSDSSVMLSTDHFQNEDVTNEAAVLSPPSSRQRSGSGLSGRESRYAAAFDFDDDDTGGAAAGGLFTDHVPKASSSSDDMSFTGGGGGGIERGIARDAGFSFHDFEPGDGGNSGGSSGRGHHYHADPEAEMSVLGTASNNDTSDDQPITAYADPYAEPPPTITTSSADADANEPPPMAALEDEEPCGRGRMGRPRSRHVMPVEEDFSVEDIIEAGVHSDPVDEAAFLECVIQDLTEGQAMGEAPSPVAEESPRGHSPPPQQQQQQQPTTAKSSSSGSGFTVTYASASAKRNNGPLTAASARGAGAGPLTSPPASDDAADDDSFELDEEAIGVIERRGYSVNSSVDSDTADFIEHVSTASASVSASAASASRNHDDDDVAGEDEWSPDLQRHNEKNDNDNDEAEEPQNVSSVADHSSNSSRGGSENEKEDGDAIGVTKQDAAPSTASAVVSAPASPAQGQNVVGTMALAPDESDESDDSVTTEEDD